MNNMLDIVSKALLLEQHLDNAKGLIMYKY